MAATLRDYLRAILDSRIDEANFTTEIASLIQQSGSWTPVLGGKVTAGTYEIGSNQSRYTRIGRRVWIDLDITLAGSITGGGAGSAIISGVPFSKMTASFPIGSVLLIGVNWTAGASLSVGFDTDSTLAFYETNDDAINSAVAITGVAANDRLIASICYETDDP